MSSHLHVHPGKREDSPNAAKMQNGDVFLDVNALWMFEVGKDNPPLSLCSPHLEELCNVSWANTLKSCLAILVLIVACQVTTSALFGRDVFEELPGQILIMVSILALGLSFPKTKAEKQAEEDIMGPRCPAP